MVPGRYGAEALAALAAVVAEIKRDDPMTFVTVIAPNNVAGIVARRHLARGQGIAAIQITTLTRLAERMAAPALAPRRPATRPVMAAAWRRVLREDPRRFRELAEHPSTVRAMAEAHARLRDLSPTGLAAVRDATPVGADLVALHETVTSRLRDAWYDATDVLTEAADLTRRGADLGAFVLYLPQALTQAEVRFAQALGDAGDLTVVAGLTGVRRADREVVQSLESLGLHIDGRPAPPVATRVRNASDSDDEIRCVVRDVVETLTATPAHRVAVLYAAPVPYARLLHEHLAAAGIAANGPGVRPVDERAVSRALLEILGLADHDVPRAALFQALASAPARDFTGTRIPVSRWERASRAAGVVAGDDWAARLQTYAADRIAAAAEESVSDDPREWMIDRLHREAEVANQLREFACRLRDELRSAAQMTTWRELSAWCLEMFTRLLGDEDALRTLPAEEQYAAAAVTSLLRGLGGLDAVDTTAAFDTFCDVVALELADSLPRIGRFGEGVFVGPISAAIGLDLDVVHICGLSEDVYPGRLGADALLPERARQATDGELPVFRERIDARHRALLATFSIARVEAVASFPRGDLRRSTRRLPSRFLLPTLRELSGDKNLAATAWREPDTYGLRMATAGSFAGELLQTTRLATEQEWRTRCAAADKTLDDDAVISAVTMIRARASNEFTRYDGNLTGVTGLPNYAVGDKAVSPTSLEGYAACPHAYFVERLLGVQQVEQPEDIVEISPQEIGNLIHESVDALVAASIGALPGPGAPWSQGQRERFVQIVEARVADYERRGLTGHPRLWLGEHTRIVSDALRLIEDDNAWRAERGAAVVASELPFGMHGAPPVEVPVPGGRVLMRGSADKVDVGADGTIYVTDIKTGSQSKFRDITQDDPLVGGTKLQLPVYAYAARARFGSSGTPVHATYWFVRRERGRRGIDLTPEVEASYATTLGVLVRSIANGLFPLRPPEGPDYAYIQCDYCNPDGIGHAENRERWERKRHDPLLRELLGLIEPAALDEIEAGQ